MAGSQDTLFGALSGLSVMAYYLACVYVVAAIDASTTLPAVMLLLVLWFVASITLLLANAGFITRYRQVFPAAETSRVVEQEEGDVVADCPNQWKLDVNDRYGRAVGVVISLASASLISPVVFLKDIIKAEENTPITAFVTSWVYAGWLFLLLSVLAGIIYYYSSAKWVKLAWVDSADIFGIRVNSDEVEKLLDISYFVMMCGFVLGFGCMLYFMVHFSG